MIYYGIPRDELILANDKKRLKGWKDVKKRDVNAPPIDRIPLPSLPEHVKNERRLAFRDLQLKKSKINLENPPSICLYTILNGNNGVCSASISENCSLFAVGFGNSMIQVNALASDDIKSLKEADELDKIATDVENDDIIAAMYKEENEKTKSIDLYGHCGPVYSVSFSCERRILLSGSRDCTIRLWNLEMRKNLVIYSTLAPVWQAQFCNRGFYFAAATADKSVSMWATDRIHPIRIFTEAKEDVMCLDFHPNCNYIVGGSDDHKIRVWDVLTGYCVQTYVGHNSPVRSIKVSPCGRYIISASVDGQLAAWDMSQQKLLNAVSLEESIDYGSPIVFSRDASTFVVGTPHYGVTFFNADALTVQSGKNTMSHVSNYSNDFGTNENCVEDFSNNSRLQNLDYSMFTYKTKGTSILDFHFTRRNTVVAVGSFNQ